MQTVNLATLISNRAGANGYRRYTANASISTGQSSTVYATPSSVTFTSSGPTSPPSVTCRFNADGSLRSGCALTFLKSTKSGYTVTESSMWNVTWGGDPVTGELRAASHSRNNSAALAWLRLTTVRKTYTVF